MVPSCSVPSQKYVRMIAGFFRCIWLFSSTHSTRALSGGFRYNPTMSGTFSTKKGHWKAGSARCLSATELSHLPTTGVRGQDIDTTTAESTDALHSHEYRKRCSALMPQSGFSSSSATSNDGNPAQADLVAGPSVRLRRTIVVASAKVRLFPQALKLSNRHGLEDSAQCRSDVSLDSRRAAKVNAQTNCA